MKDVLLSALSGITFGGAIVPVVELKYTGTSKTWITFYTLLEKVEVFADDEEQEMSIHFTVDIFTNKPNFDSLKKEVRNRLKSAGFIITSSTEIFEKDTQIYHIPIDCWIENLEEE